MRRFLILTGLFSGTFYLVLLAVVYFNQNSLLFRPSIQPLEEQTRIAEQHGLVPWMSANGSFLGWKPQPTPEAPLKKMLIVFHGNGGDALWRWPLTERIGPEWEVRFLEYPGYGPRDGELSESTLTAAALEGIDSIESPDLYILGESLGSGIACIAAAQRPGRIKGLFLVSPYANIPGVAAARYPFLPVSLLLKTRINAEAALKSFSGPVAFVVSENDSMIPNRCGRQLYESYPHQKQWWTTPNAGHDTDRILEKRWSEMAAWMSGAGGS